MHGVHLGTLPKKSISWGHSGKRLAAGSQTTLHYSLDRLNPSADRPFLSGSTGCHSHSSNILRMGEKMGNISCHAIHIFAVVHESVYLMSDAISHRAGAIGTNDRQPTCHAFKYSHAIRFPPRWMQQDMSCVVETRQLIRFYPFFFFPIQRLQPLLIPQNP